MATCRRCGGMSFACSPPSHRLPAVMSSIPATMRSVEVLPQPDGPSRTSSSPSATSIERSSTASTPAPEVLDTWASTTDDICPPAQLLTDHALFCTPVLKASRPNCGSLPRPDICPLPATAARCQMVTNQPARLTSPCPSPPSPPPRVRRPESAAPSPPPRVRRPPVPAEDPCLAEEKESEMTPYLPSDIELPSKTGPRPGKPRDGGGRVTRDSRVTREAVRARGAREPEGRASQRFTDSPTGMRA